MDLRERTASAHRHPWELARADFLRRLLADHVQLATVTYLLDVGAGDSWFAETLVSDLAPGARVVCWDAHYSDADLDEAPPGVRRVRDAPAERFPVVTALDVLEHVEDDDAFLAQLAERLAPGAILLATVPAHPRLFSGHDRMLGHHRRYRPRALRELVREHLDVVAAGSFFTTLLGPRLLQVAIERTGRQRDETGVGQWSRGPTLTALIRRALGADAAAGYALARRGIAVPGLSTWVVATTKGPA